MNGFSENDATPEIGHLYGVRWFQFVLPGEDCRELTVHRDSVDVTAMDPSSTVFVPGSFTVSCSCGQAVTQYSGQEAVTRFMAEHDPLAAGQQKIPVLRGACDAWQPGENVATCLPPTLGPAMHAAPHRECLCGFWAYWTLGQQYTSAPHVVGIVKGYGNVIQGRLGFRCSHAKVVALFLPSRNATAAGLLHTRYQVPAYCDLDEMLEAHPAPEGQPPLADGFYTAPDGGGTYGTGGVFSTWTAPGAVTGGGYSYSTGGGGGGGYSYSTPVGKTAMAAHLKSLAVPCNRCGTQACHAGQLLCAACQLNSIHDGRTW